jgi:hypothetical protein
VLLFFSASLSFSSSSFEQAQQTSPRTAPQTDPVQRRIKQLGLDEVLSWRLEYEDLLGKGVAVVKERYGPPDTQDKSGAVYYFRSARTRNRYLKFDIGDGTVLGVSVFLNAQRDFPEEDLDIMKVLVKAPLFCFSSGTYADSTINFFNAELQDRRTVLQFTIGDDSLLFHRVMFFVPGKPCDPRGGAPAK